jgi:glycosyltransferase involved in cell wall biosynthesis
MPEPRLSILIVARDEEEKLPGCLASVRFADERIVVVDAASRDATLNIAQETAEHVLVRDFDNFASQRNAALSVATGDWVLSIDADERVTPELATEIRRLLSDEARPFVGYRIPIHSEVLGRSFRFSGTQNDRPIRLFRRNAGRWTGLVHETVSIDGPVGQTDAGLAHRTLENIGIFLAKLDRYTTLEARELYESGHRFRTRDLLTSPLYTFLRVYLYHQGFRDGLEGLMFCALSGLSVAARGWKLRELERWAIAQTPSERAFELARGAS